MGRFQKWIKKATKYGSDKKSITFFLFWDTQEDDIEQVAELLDNRQFSKFIRISLRVIPALWRGDLEPLFQEFPWVRAEFLEYMKEVQSEPVPADIKYIVEEAIAGALTRHPKETVIMGKEKSFELEAVDVNVSAEDVTSSMMSSMAMF